MSTHIDDLASAAVVASGVAPAAQTASLNGSAIDLVSGDGPCFAVQHVGQLTGSGATLNSWIEESQDGSTSWTAIDGAGFDTVTTSNHVQVIRFTRTARYVRWAGTITGTTPSVNLAVLIGEGRKTI